MHAGMCTPTRTHIRTHARMHAPTHARIHTHTHARTHTHTRTHERTHAHTHMHAHIRTHTHARAHAYTHTHTRARTHTHARTHAHKSSHCRSWLLIEAIANNTPENKECSYIFQYVSLRRTRTPTCTHTFFFDIGQNGILGYLLLPRNIARIYHPSVFRTTLIHTGPHTPTHERTRTHAGSLTSIQTL